MRKLSLFLVPLLLATLGSPGQTPKKVIAEHFTNTLCSICASRNPGFFDNLNKHPGVLHLAIHPSSPYSACILNKHNKTENDGRTNYYGIYGGTPRLVIQGKVVPNSANYSHDSLFSKHLNQTSPASISIRQSKYGSDSIRASIIVKTTATHSLGALKLFIALAEDTIFYTSPNGEKLHFDVFRKSLSGFEGLSLNLPATIGDSLVFTASSPVHADWDFSRIYTLAVLQEESTQSVVQAEAVSPASNTLTNGLAKQKGLFQVNSFPNPLQGQLHISLNTPLKSQATLYDINGRLVVSREFNTQTGLPTDKLRSGTYLLVIENPLGQVSKQLVK